MLFMIVLSIYSCEGLQFSDSSSSQATISGSYANMLVLDDFMYIINKEKLLTYSVYDKKDPLLIDTKDLGFNIESLLHYKGKLFIGSSESMYIYERNQSGIPVKLSETSYADFGSFFCQRDPIAVNDTHAFVTLSSVQNQWCGRFEVNELRVYDINNFQDPQIISQVTMESPKGIGLDGDYLFVCEEENGVVIFDVSVPETPKIIQHFKGFKAFDLIPDNGLLIVVGPDQLHEFDYSIISNIKYLSSIDL